MSDVSPSKLTAYFRSCYQADNRELNIPYFLSQKIEHNYSLENTDLIEGHIPIFPVDEKWHAAVNKELNIYAKEKELFMASHFLLGYGMVGGKGQRIFAPLFLHPAHLEIENEEYYVSIDIEKRIFNPTFIRLLKSEENDDIEAYEEIMQSTPEGFIDFAKNGIIKDNLLKHFPQLCLDDMLLFPEVPDPEKLKKMLSQVVRQKTSDFRVIPMQMLGVIRKSTHTQGVLNELKQIASEEEFSKPLRSLFLKEEVKMENMHADQIFVPVNLNAAQVKTFDSVRKHAITYVVGPPGTGKSFTISALAIDFLSRGKSVLIASANNQAVDVIADKIEKDFQLPGVLVRGGRQDYKRQLKERLQALMNGMVKLTGNQQVIRSLERKTKRLHAGIKTRERQFEKQEEREIRYGQSLLSDDFLSKVKHWWIKFRTSASMALWDMLAKYQKDLDSYNAAIKRLVKEKFDAQLKFSLSEYREQLQRFEMAIKARTATRKEVVFSTIDFEKLTSTFPIWLVSLSEVSNVLPLKKEMFDVVIIDEATQCDIATAIPVMQRGKRVIISGDPKQLRHVSFLSRKRLSLLQEQYDLGNVDSNLLDFRDNSLLDIVNDTIQYQDQISFLNEHYRSFPHIIEFSNKTFYNKALNVILSTPQTQREEHVFVNRIMGERSIKGVNIKEIEAILEKTNSIIEEDKPLPVKRCRSIGILSPFREQVNQLIEYCAREISHEKMERHQVLVGTAHSFQGEERDIMLLSFVLDDNAHSTAFRHLNRPDVFNVSITRSKTEQYVFVSMSQKKLKADMLLTRYLDDVENYLENTIEATTKTESKDRFMKSVLLALSENGFNEVYVAYPVAGIEVDVLVIHNTISFCIDLIGYPGEFEAAFPIERYKMLNRVGMKVFPLPYSMWVHQKNIAIKALKSFLSK